MAGPPPTLRLLDDAEVNYPPSGRFKLLGSWLPDCEDDMTTRIGMAWAHLHDHRRWWSNPALPRIVKRDLFKVVILTILTYGAETWTLTQELEQRLDGAVTKMLRKALNIPFGLHISNEDLYADLPYVSHIIRHRRLGLAGHLARTDQVDTSDRLAGTKPAQPGRYVLTWRAPGRARQGRHPWTFRDRLGMDMCYTRRDGLTPGQPPGLSVIWRQMVRKDRWQVVMKETTPKPVGAPRVTKYGIHSDSGRGAHTPVTRT
jgi:hypothetical protein